ncbi:MAG: transcriptional regulator, GntR family [Acidimicrobiales bacterium]|nr:transcriptional regulator, GntR family [Acidimicrobiales bacterium]
MSGPSGGRNSRAAPRDGETGPEAVARYIRKLIFEGRLEAGQRLPQDEIAHAVGVSRIPVREAIISLEREGWLRGENHRGAFVLPLDERAVTDRFALYGRFHGFAARRAIDHLTPEDLDELEALAAKLADATGATAMERANGRYLAKLVSLAASNRLRAVLRSTSQIVPGNFFASVDGSIEIQQRGIAAIQAAVAAGERERAEQASIDLHAEQAAALVAVMQRPGGRTGRARG